MTTLHQDAGGVLAFTKGAAERVVPLCGAGMIGDRVAPLDVPAIVAAVDSMATEASGCSRSPCDGCRSLPSDPSAETVERNLTLIALVGLRDPPRRRRRMRSPSAAARGSGRS